MALTGEDMALHADLGLDDLRPELLGKRARAGKLGTHAGALQMVSIDRPDHGGRRVIGAADDDGDAAIAQPGENAGGPGGAVGMNDEGANVVERDASAFFIAGSYGQETAMHGKEKVIGFYVDHALHEKERNLSSVFHQY